MGANLSVWACRGKFSLSICCFEGAAVNPKKKKKARPSLFVHSFEVKKHVSAISHAIWELPSTDGTGKIWEGENHSERKGGNAGGKGNGMRKGEAGGWEAGLKAHGEGRARAGGTSFLAVV